MKKLKILLAKPGLDGHDVGVKVLAHALKDAGFEVKYTGLRKSIEEILEMAKLEKVDAIGLSILSGTHLVLCNRMRQVMEEMKLSIPWVAGGNIPAGDCEELRALGASEAFPTGTTIETVVQYFDGIQSKMEEIAGNKKTKISA